MRKRMEVEKQRFINYIDNKRTNKILRDVAEFLECLGAGRGWKEKQ